MDDDGRRVGDEQDGDGTRDRADGIGDDHCIRTIVRRLRAGDGVAVGDRAQNICVIEPPLVTQRRGAAGVLADRAFGAGRAAADHADAHPCEPRQRVHGLPDGEAHPVRPRHA